jgi:hypothetical protein
MSTLSILVSDSEAVDSSQPNNRSDDRLGLARSGQRTSTAERSPVREFDVDRLRKSISHLASQLSDLFADLKSVGEMKLTEVNVSVEVSAEGGLVLVGKAGVTGGISLKFEP